MMLFLRKKKIEFVENWLPQTLRVLLEEAGFDPDAAVRFRHSTRARRLSLRTDVKKHCVILIFPASATWRQAQEFVESQQCWILQQLQEVHVNAIEFAAELELPILGIQHKIVPTGKLRGVCYRENGNLYVSGTPEHLSRRVMDYLKKEARFEIAWRAREKAEKIAGKISRIRIGDTSTRWGSCTSKGVLSFSWRLILAPEDKLDYVVAHEVAHLQYMNHSKDFWKLCASLTDTNVAECRKWFKKDGVSLFSYRA